eukprot:9608031-Alexandrium_andersonii.AAC.1
MLPAVVFAQTGEGKLVQHLEDLDEVMASASKHVRGGNGEAEEVAAGALTNYACLLYTSPSPRD